MALDCIVTDRQLFSLFFSTRLLEHCSKNLDITKDFDQVPRWLPIKYALAA